MTRNDSIAGYVDGLRARARERKQAAAARMQAIAPRLAMVVDRLVREFGATRVTLFGSYARGEPRKDSDVDLLVEGLSPDDILEASVMADRVFGDVRVDLVPASIARAAIRQRAIQEGRVLHG